ncbi:MAG: hypothetical protein RI988_2177 [Pseudomonadota bacterium]
MRNCNAATVRTDDGPQPSGVSRKADGPSSRGPRPAAPIAAGRARQEMSFTSPSEMGGNSSSSTVRTVSLMRKGMTPR